MTQQRDALDESNRGLFDSINLAKDKATVDAAAATKAAAILTEKTGLQSQLDQLTLTSAQLLVQQRDALDESTRALFDQVQAATAAKQAQDMLTAATAAMVDRIKGTLATLADSRPGLAARLLTAQGKPAEALALTRSTELKKLIDGLSATDAALITTAYNYNTGIEDQISATEAATAASAAAASQAQSLRDAWASVGAAIADEIKRILGIAGDPQNLASAQAQFAVSTAQARAGDQDAAKLLPGLSRALLDLAQASAASATDMAIIRGRTAASLSNTLQALAPRGVTVPTFAHGGAHAGGLRLVGEGGPEIESTGAARIWSAKQTAGMLGGAAPELLEELRALRAEVAALRAEQRAAGEAVATHTGKTARILDRLAPSGDSLTVKVAA